MVCVASPLGGRYTVGNVMASNSLKEKLNLMDANKLFKWLAWILSVSSATIVGVVLFYANHFNGSLSDKQEHWGAFGDFIGGTLNPILSFFALIALLLTIVLQSKELEGTKEELRRSAEAQENSEKSFKEQSKILSRQQFESTFFSLLEQHNKLIEKLNECNEGRVDRAPAISTLKMYVLAEETLSNAKIKLENYNYLCGHYFRVLYQLLKFIATSIPDSHFSDDFDSEKIIMLALAPNEKMYSNIVRSFISYDLTQLLAVNCYCDDSKSTYWKFKNLLERYEFLEHMPFEVDGNRNYMLETSVHYYQKAFGDSGFVKSLSTTV